MQPFSKKPFLGFGLGLRTEHYETILTDDPPLDWFEIITENYLVSGGKPLYFLDQFHERYPLVMHGVSLSIGSTDNLDWTYLQEVKALAKRIQAGWVSDHLCWTGVKGLNTHDLLPLPYTEETIEHIAARIRQVQDYLERPFLIENLSSYITYTQSEMTEWDFLNEIVRRANCYILLDVNNVYVSSVNHGFNPLDYIHAMPASRVLQIHLAGHSHEEDYIVDTHDAPIVQEVWDLYAKTIQHLGPVSTMVERDDNIPPLSVLVEEVQQARAISNRVLQEVVLV
jgi:uncharacterized protein (UPF0276 family)